MKNHPTRCPRRKPARTATHPADPLMDLLAALVRDADPKVRAWAALLLVLRSAVQASESMLASVWRSAGRWSA